MILFCPMALRLSGLEHLSCRPDKTLASSSGTTNSNQMLKEEPHPQVLFAFGLVTMKREPSRPSV
ncbi:hypothetical protein CWG77_20800 [Salmonella enterica subsp. enterica serovar Senftenberg]|nr:hypothetical protein [Salmonella enterica subsp. enterica serovar Senftenberg]